MHPMTPGILQAVRSKETTEEKLDVLRDAYQGETAFLLSCGPSIRQHPDKFYIEKLRDRFVMCVKQAHDLMKNSVDVHLLNTGNLQRYHYPGLKPLVAFSYRQERASMVPGSLKWDLVFPFSMKTRWWNRSRNRARWLSQSLVSTQDFESWMLDRSIERPAGPGIVLEVGLYLLLHMGFRQVISIRYDSVPAEGQEYRHHYGSPHKPRHNTVRKWFSILRARCPLCHVERLRYRFGRKIYPTHVMKGEAEAINQGVAGMYEWLRQKGCQWSIGTHPSYLSSAIPRVDVYKHMSDGL